MNSRKCLVLLLSVAALSACAGDPGAQGTRGPEGPPGPTGAQGPTGPNTTRDQLPCARPDAGTSVQPMVDMGLTCIETAPTFDRNAPLANASFECQRDGLRLCTYTEWLLGCTQYAAQLGRMTDNWEWVDGALPDGDGGVVGLLVGNGSCTAASADGVLSPHAFRCCQ